MPGSECSDFSSRVDRLDGDLICRRDPQCAGGTLVDFRRLSALQENKASCPNGHRMHVSFRARSRLFSITVFNAYPAKCTVNGNFEFIIPCEGTLTVPYVVSLVKRAPHQQPFVAGSALSGPPSRVRIQCRRPERSWVRRATDRTPGTAGARVYSSTLGSWHITRRARRLQGRAGNRCGPGCRHRPDADNGGLGAKRQPDGGGGCRMGKNHLTQA
jgi:hypothetical protein